jgi:hypothetical protein
VRLEPLKGAPGFTVRASRNQTGLKYGRTLEFTILQAVDYEIAPVVRA